MTTPTEEATDLYAKLKPGALADARAYILTRTPPELQEIMAGLIEADIDPPPDPTVAVIHDGASVSVNDAADAPVAGSPGVATVVDGALTKINLTV